LIANFYLQQHLASHASSQLEGARDVSAKRRVSLLLPSCIHLTSV
jgi:hypothetical protein